jgi:integrase
VLPRGEKARDRIAGPAEAAALLAALPEGHRATWGTAMYAGLRRGELMALRVNRIDLDANLIRVEKGWDVKAGEIGTKNGKDRKVPITAPLRELLLPHLMRTGPTRSPRRS